MTQEDTGSRDDAQPLALHNFRKILNKSANRVQRSEIAVFFSLSQAPRLHPCHKTDIRSA
jgi:hypothetical protein